MTFRRTFDRSADYLAAILLILPVLMMILSFSRVDAANLTTTYIRLNRLKAGQTTSFRLQFRTVASGATSVVINFNGTDSTTWTGSSGAVNTTQTADSSTCSADTGGDTALPGSLSASGSGST